MGTTVLRWIGDLDHPHYDDERNRHVWYEASAISFQIMFLGSFYMGGAVLWFLGADALPFVFPMLMPMMVASLVFTSYAEHHTVEYWPTSRDLRRGRSLLGVGAGLILISGLARASLQLASNTDSRDGFTGGFADVFRSPLVFIGVIAAGFGGMAFAFWKGSQQSQLEQAELSMPDED